MHLTTSTTLPTPSLHLHQSAMSFFLKPIYLMFPSTCVFYFIFGQPCLHFLSTSCTICFIKTSSLVISNMTIPPHIVHSCQLISCFLQYQHVHQLLCIPLVHQLYTAHRFHHRSISSSQNNCFIFSHTPCFASI